MNVDHTGCIVAAQVGESGTCELTHATMCLVLNTVALTTPVSGKHWNDDAANELADGFVFDSTDDFVAGLLAGECDADGNCDGGGIVVAPLPKGPPSSSFTAEIAVDSMDACQDLLDMFTDQLADPDSSLRVCSGGDLVPCWELDPGQTLETHCIDSTDSGR